MSFWAKVKMIFGKVWTWLEPVLQVAAKDLMSQVVLPAAYQAVLATANYALDNDEEKRKTAYNMIVEELKQKSIAVGVQVTTSQINWAIESMVMKAKEENKI